MKSKKKRSIFSDLNKPILFITLIFMISGALLILDASSISSVLKYGLSSPYYFFKWQIIFIVIGLVASLIIINIDSKHYKIISSGLVIGFAILTYCIFVKNKLFTSDVSEVTLDLGFFKFQPGELLKPLIVMFLGSYFGPWANREHKPWGFVFPLCVCAFAIAPIALGGDFGTTAIMLAICGLVFACIPSRQKNDKFLRIAKGITIFGLVAFVFLLRYLYLFVPEDKLLTDYRLTRFLYKNPCDRYEDVSGYQVCNGYIAIDNGGIKGVGIGNSIQKYLYLPESHTDFIFPIVVEELGVLSGIIILISYAILIYLVFKVAVNCHKLQNSIICYGIAIYFMVHIFVNLGGVLGLIPLTGVPLPFLSYGGSFCVTLICSFAVVQRINIENNREMRRKELLKSN